MVTNDIYIKIPKIKKIETYYSAKQMKTIYVNRNNNRIIVNI